MARTATTADFEGAFQAAQPEVVRMINDQKKPFLEGVAFAIESVRLGKPVFLTPDWIPLEAREFAREGNATGPFFPRTEGNTTIIRRIPDSGPAPFDDDEESGLPFKGTYRQYGSEQGIRFVMRWLAQHHVYAVNSSRRKRP